MPGTEYFATTEAAAKLAIHPRTLRAWDERGIIRPAIATRPDGAGRCWRFYSGTDIEKLRRVRLREVETVAAALRE